MNGKKISTYVYFHSLHWERLNWRYLVGHEPVELVSPLVPLDTIQGVTVQVVGAHQVCAVTRLNISRDAQVYLGGAVQF